MRFMDVVWFYETVIAAARAAWVRRKGRRIVVRRSVIDMANALEAEAVAKGLKPQNAIGLAEKRREAVRDKEGVEFWREVFYYMAYMDGFRPPDGPCLELSCPEEKPDVLVIEDC